MRTQGETEDAIQARGRDLLNRIEPVRLFTLTPAWWQEQMLSWANADPDFRVKLLQFVDVLPALRTSAAVADHVRQYFRDAGPAITSAGAGLASRRVMRPVLSRAVRRGIHTMAERFIAGATPSEALPHLRRLTESGAGHTVDLLGEATLSDAEADGYTERYVSLIETLAGAAPDWPGDTFSRAPNISVKLSALAPHFEPAAPEATADALGQRLRRIFEAARRHDVFVYIDMEQYRYRDLIHHVAERELGDGPFADWPGAGMVVQAYLRDAADDVARLGALAARRGTPLHIRLVKGAYWDEETIVAKQEGHPVPVFEDKSETDANFEHCTGLLLDWYPRLRPAFASHHPRSVAQAMVRAEAAGVPVNGMEFQMLYGMAEGLRRAVVDAGYRTRVYVPTGEIIPGMAYLVRRLLENTSNASWLLHRHEQPDASVLEPPGPAEPTPPEPVDPVFRNHPHAEFHLGRDRAAMRDALTSVRGAFGEDWPAIIDGETTASGEWDDVRPPAHPGTLMARVARSTREMAAGAVDAAYRALPGWQATPCRERAAILRKAADMMAGRRWELAATMVYESAKPWHDADGDVTEAIDFLRYYALQAEELASPPGLSLVPAETNHLRYEARGVAAVIAPWNFPLAIATGMTAGALAAGCPAVLKPAEQSPVIAAKLVAILHEAGVPAGAVHYLPGRGEEAGDALVQDPRVAVVAFTGSREVGLRIVEASARGLPGQRHVRKVIAEMGGKNAIVVDDDADLDQAVAGVVSSAFGFAGQKCSACSRVLVVGDAYDEFRSRLADAVRSLAVGAPEDPFTFVPPVISDEARETIERYIAIGDADGKLVAKSATPDGGHYVAAHVFEDVPPDSRLTREEVFGPVLALYRAPTFDDAITMAIDSDYALTGGVYSRNPRNIEHTRDRFVVGNLYINRAITGSMVGRQPFAGFAMSGTGEKAGGPGYVRNFVFERVVTENTMRRGFAPERPD